MYLLNVQYLPNNHVGFRAWHINQHSREKLKKVCLIDFWYDTLMNFFNGFLFSKVMK